MSLKTAPNVGGFFYFKKKRGKIVYINSIICRGEYFNEKRQIV